jgi:hypothetical protein
VGYEAVATGPVTRELLYVADVQATKTRGELMLKIVERPRRKDGTWGKEKTARVPITELPRLSDEHDREILPLLQAISEAERGYNHYSYTPPTFSSEVCASCPNTRSAKKKGGNPDGSG